MGGARIRRVLYHIPKTEPRCEADEVEGDHEKVRSDQHVRDFLASEAWKRLQDVQAVSENPGRVGAERVARKSTPNANSSAWGSGKYSCNKAAEKKLTRLQKYD